MIIRLRLHTANPVEALVTIEFQNPWILKARVKKPNCSRWLIRIHFVATSKISLISIFISVITQGLAH